MNILQEIAECTKERVAAQKAILPMDELMQMAQGAENAQFPFEEALRAGDIAFICEIKKASPSKGVIAHNFPYTQIAKEYEDAGAAAISVLTEPFYFQGSDQYLREIAQTVSIPLLRKDFTVDGYMIYEAKILGASAVLLICAILDPDTLAEYIAIAHSIGLSALVEAHDEEEVAMALAAGARVVGVNNRNLKTFDVDIGLSARLRPLVPPGVIFVAESGIKTPEDVDKMRKIGADAVLIGEAIMGSGDKPAMISHLRGLS